MRRWLGFGLAVALVAGVLVPWVGVEVGARQATPAAAPVSGLVTELLGLGAPPSAPGQALQLIRVTLEPGGHSVPHARPGVRLNHVLEGIWVFHLLSGDVEAKRQATGGATGPAEPLTPGAEYTFTAGDTLFLRENAIYESRNPGPDPLVVLIAALSPTDALATTYLVATPTSP